MESCDLDDLLLPDPYDIQIRDHVDYSNEELWWKVSDLCNTMIDRVEFLYWWYVHANHAEYITRQSERNGKMVTDTIHDESIPAAIEDWSFRNV